MVGTTSQTNMPDLSPEILGNEMVKLYVGPDRTEFTIHKKLLCDKSKYFAAAFKSGFEEGRTGEMVLEEEETSTISSFVTFIYRGTVPSVSLSGENGFSPTFHARQLYYFAEKIYLVELMDRLLDSIKEYYLQKKKSIRAKPVLDVYNHTHSKSKLRYFCATLVVTRVAQGTIDGASIRTHMSTLEVEDCPDFFKDYFLIQSTLGNELSEARWAKKKPLAFPNLDPCEFHTHGPKETCYLKIGTKEDVAACLNFEADLDGESCGSGD